ncbi:PIN domain nuclease [Aquincola tertiaricarbonis]|uniref:Ribonuclease VapC n=1 Tax=Aquincola tertiaricarbonis TaxID=391953 RepID=A0ABY4SBS3_AQUTE|nr:PIN domain nuclease [Aquincola tertiaricarbonis]URI10045.1 PIN domain nuclease [Aquincola tertiaricarbonis]
MILVDSSVWIDYFRSADTPQVALLDSYLGRTPLAIGDLIAAEVLQGVRDDKQFKSVKQVFDAFTQIDLCGYDLAIKASENYRLLRSKGITIRKTIDTLIATRCIDSGLTLLHADADFRPFAEHLGLREAFSDG